MTTFDYYLMSIGFGIFGVVYIFAIFQNINVRKKSKKWPEVSSCVAKIQSYDGGGSSLYVEYLFSDMRYEAWTFNAHGVPTDHFKKGDVVVVKVDPLNPERNPVLLPPTAGGERA